VDAERIVDGPKTRGMASKDKKPAKDRQVVACGVVCDGR
jgi:hypothetical protein